MSRAAHDPVGATLPPAADRPKEKLVCKSYKVTGTRLGRSEICMTKAQWDFENDQLNSDHRNRLGRGNKVPAR